MQCPGLLIGVSFLLSDSPGFSHIFTQMQRRSVGEPLSHACDRCFGRVIEDHKSPMWTTKCLQADNHEADIEKNMCQDRPPIAKRFVGTLQHSAGHTAAHRAKKHVAAAPSSGTAAAPAPKLPSAHSSGTLQRHQHPAARFHAHMQLFLYLK